MSDNTQLQGIWTQYGQEKLAGWLAGGASLAITHAAVGNGGGSVPTVKPSQGALVAEEWRGLVNSVQVNPEDATDVIVDVVLPNNIGGFWIREWGLFDDAGKLVAVGPHAEMHKPLITSGQAAEVRERFHLPVSNTGAVTLTIATQALATQSFVTSQVEAHNVADNAHMERFGHTDAHIIKTLDLGAHGFPMGKEGQILAVQNGKLVWINPYPLGKLEWFDDEMSRPGFFPCLGGLVTNVSQTCPEIVEYLQTSYGRARCVTQAEYDALHVATWYTCADGTKIGWDGIGGVAKFVLDLDADTLRLPDLAGMSPEMVGCDSLGVGGVHGDAVRPVTGELGVVRGAGEGDAIAGSFYSAGIRSSNGAGNSGSYPRIAMDISRVAPVAAKNQVRAWGSLACVYLGQPAS